MDFLRTFEITIFLKTHLKFGLNHTGLVNALVDDSNDSTCARNCDRTGVHLHAVNSESEHLWRLHKIMEKWEHLKFLTVYLTALRVNDTSVSLAGETIECGLNREVFTIVSWISSRIEQTSWWVLVFTYSSDIYNNIIGIQALFVITKCYSVSADSVLVIIWFSVFWRI